MTMRTTVPIASRRAFVGLGAAAALSASASGATPPGLASVPAPRKVVRCQSSGRIVQQAKMPQMLLSLRRCGAGSSQNSSRKRFARALKQYGTAC